MRTGYLKMPKSIAINLVHQISVTTLLKLNNFRYGCMTFIHEYFLLKRIAKRVDKRNEDRAVENKFFSPDLIDYFCLEYLSLLPLLTLGEYINTVMNQKLISMRNFSYTNRNIYN